MQPKTRTMSLENGKIRRQNSPQRRSNRNSQSMDDIYLKDGAANVIKLFVPISLCMLIVVTTINCIPSIIHNGTALFRLSPFSFHESEIGIFDTFTDAVTNSLIFVSVTIISTTIFVILYVYKFYKVLVAFLFISALTIFFGLTLFFLYEVLKAFHVPVDIFSAVICYWNICVTAITCVFWRGPLKLQQGYLIFISAGAALILIIFLPNWTTWVLLITLSIWDIIAVLTPHGPLKKLIDTFIERDDMEFPSLIYSTLVYNAITTSADKNQNNDEPIGDEYTSTVNEYDSESSESNQQSNGTRSPRANSRSSRKSKRSSKKSKRSEKGGGFKLGLGDFIFYGVLIGKVSSSGNLFSTFACFLTTLIGLCFTLFLLMSFKKALPALPISIALGMAFYFVFEVFIRNFADNLEKKQIFV